MVRRDTLRIKGTHISAIPLALLVGALVTPCIYAAAVPTPLEIATKLDTNASPSENLFMKARWSEYSEGKLTKSTTMEYHTDSVGRIRIVREVAGASEPRTDQLFDGEKTINASLDPNRDRSGKKLDSALQSSTEAGYRFVQIHDGRWPRSGGGLQSTRHPFNYISNFVRPALKRALSNGEAVQVAAVDGSGTVFQVSFKDKPRRSESDLDTISFTIDADKDWGITNVERRSAKGKLIYLAECDYSKDAKGQWLPQTGTYRLEARDAATSFPLREVQFTVSDAKINDPSFDESVFDYTFEPGTTVSDLRYDVVYHIGDEQRFDEDLASLATAALKNREAGNGGLEVVPARSRWTSPFLIGNVLAVVILISLIVRSRLQSK